MVFQLYESKLLGVDDNKNLVRNIDTFQLLELEWKNINRILWNIRPQIIFLFIDHTKIARMLTNYLIFENVYQSITLYKYYRPLVHLQI